MIQAPRGMSIMEAYEIYRNNRFIVNRVYQRKLVWSVKEKQALVDSVLNKFPIPLILLAELPGGLYEIIDGMQRLNAFFGFIENQFPILINNSEQYFQIDDYTFAKTIFEKKIFEKKMNVSYISQKLVSDFISYQFPITIYQTDHVETINETFRRINAFGRHLSDQEVRQAGVINKFTTLVRELSSEIRGDVSNTTLLLSQMPEISVDSNQTKLNYGVVAEETFWCKQGILNTSLLREGEDEQMIADIVLSIALGKPFPASKQMFDNYYGKGDKDLSSDIEVRINTIGSGNIKKDVKTVYSTIVNFTETFLEGKRLKNVLHTKAKGNPVKAAFYTLFMAFYELMIKEGMEPFDNYNIVKAITDLHPRLKQSANYTKIEDRIKNINICKGLIRDYFKKTNDVYRSAGSWTIDFQNYLTRSKVEAASYDFKQGFYDLNDKGRRLSDKTFEDKILCSIAALANLGKNRTGYLFIGVTDKEEDTKRVEKIDKLKDVPRFHNFGIVGLEREAKLKGVSLDNYITSIIEKISSSQLPSELKTQITKDITPVTYYNYTVLLIPVRAGNSPVFYKEKLYTRDGANCKEVKGSNISDIYALFK